MKLIPKTILDQLVKNNLLSASDAEKYEVESLKKDLPIDEYLVTYSNLDKIQILDYIFLGLN